MSGPAEHFSALTAQGEVMQTIYPYGGSRIWLHGDDSRGRHLLVDTYGDEELAVAIKTYIEACREAGSWR